LGHYIILSGEVLIYIEEMAALRLSFKTAAPTASRNWSIMAARAQALAPVFSLRSA
jgi:hypothetical protein